MKKKKLKEILPEEAKISEDEWQILCPAHNDNDPSLSVKLDRDKGRYILYCHSGCDFGDILKALKLKEEDLYLQKKVIKEYIYQDENGNEVYKKLRYEPKDFRIVIKKGNKWVNEKGLFRETKHYLYHLPSLLASKKPVLLVESEKSVERLEEEGFIATTSGGAGSWEPHFNDWLKNRSVYIIPDNDKPGEEFAKEVGNQLLGKAKAIYVLELPHKKPKDDIYDFLENWGAKELKRRLKQAQPFRPNRLLKLSQVRSVISEPLIKIATGKKTIGFKTGYDKLDRATGGLAPGNLWILAARPSVGKTAMALNFIINNPQAKIVFFSLEMNDMDIVQRLLSYHTGFSLTELRNGLLSNNGDLKKLKAAQNKLDKYNCLIEDTPHLSLRSIERKLSNINGVDLIIVDYLGIMDIGNNENRNNALGDITSGMRALGKKVAAPVLMLSQLSRNCEYREPPIPVLADLRDSGNIEQDADGVMFLYRPKNEDGIMKNSADLIIAKNRHGACYGVKFLFDYKRMYFMPRGE